MWAGLIDGNQTSTSSNMGGSTPLYDEISEAGSRDPRQKKRANTTQTTGAPPEKVQIRNGGTIFVTVAPGNNVMLVKPNQTRVKTILLFFWVFLDVGKLASPGGAACCLHQWRRGKYASI